MHISEVERIQAAAATASEAELREYVRRLSEAYIFRLKRPTYYLTQAQIDRAFSGCYTLT